MPPNTNPIDQPRPRDDTGPTPVPVHLSRRWGRNRQFELNKRSDRQLGSSTLKIVPEGLQVSPQPEIGEVPNQHRG